MQEFIYKNEELHCEGVSLKSIAAAVGTPTFVYSKNAMVARIRAYEVALAEAPHIVAYAIKANTNINSMRVKPRLFRFIICEIS